MIKLKQQIVIGILVWLFAPFFMAGFAQGTVNPLYLDGVAECLKAPDPEDPSDITRAEFSRTAIPIDPDNPDKVIYAVSKDCLLSNLETSTKLGARKPSEYGLDQYGFLKGRLAPSSSPLLPPLERFKGNMNALHFRRSLLRLFEAARSGGTRDLIVVPYVRGNSKTDPRAAFTSEGFCEAFGDDPEKMYSPLFDPAKDDQMISFFLRDKDEFGQEMDFLILSRPAPDETELWAGIKQISCPQVHDTFDTVTTPVVSGVMRDIEAFAASKQVEDGHGTTRQFHLVENREALTATEKSPMKISLPLKLDESDNAAALEVDVAMGLVWTRKNDRYEESFSPYIAYDQSQVDEVIAEHQLPNGEKYEETKKIALGNLFLGIERRTKYTITGDDCEIASITKTIAAGDGRSGLYAPTCSKLPGPEVAFAAQFITDNYLDQRGVQLEYSYTPSIITPLLRDIPGFRYPAQLSAYESTRTSRPEFWNIVGNVYVEWDAELVLDALYYDVAPLDLKTLAPSDRVGDTYVRAGVDLAAELGLPNYFAPSLDNSRVSLKAEWSYREGLLAGNPSANLVTLSLIFKDIANERFDFGVSYTKGSDFVNFSEEDTLALELKSKF